MQNTDISADPADSCAIYMTVHHASGKKLPALSAHCRFDDHIRCVAAKKNLNHKRESLRLAKMASICYMLDLPNQLSGHSHPKALHYSKLTIVNTVSSCTPVTGSHDHMTSAASPLVKEEAIQLSSKNDDGSVMLPFDKGVEMDTLGGSFAVTARSPQQQLNMFFRSSSFSHEEHHHLDQQQNVNFSERHHQSDQHHQNDQQSNNIDHQAVRTGDHQIINEITDQGNT